MVQYWFIMSDPQPRQRHLHRQEKVVQSLRSDILDGRYPPGSRLPPERDLAGKYGIARNTLRRLLEELAEEGLVERQVSRGTFVVERRRVSGHKSHSGDLSDSLRGASPADLMEVRLIIEPQVAALAASRATAEDLTRIEGALRQSVAAKGLAEFEHWDAQLHLAIFHAAKNALLLDYCTAINAVRNEPDWYRLKQRSVTPERRLHYDREHSDIVTALRERDPEAARKQLFRHLSGIRNTLLSLSE